MTRPGDRGLEASRAALDEARQTAAGGTRLADSVAEDVDRLRRQADALPAEPAGDGDRGGGR